jgi:hypothetical protein
VERQFEGFSTKLLYQTAGRVERQFEGFSTKLLYQTAARAKLARALCGAAKSAP